MDKHLRKETDCLNCGAEVTVRYCPKCGQENIKQPEKIWSLIAHYFEDFTHYDGNMFKSLWILVSRPGFLTNAYNAGQRKRYINPIRMYIFISLITFTYMFLNIDLTSLEGETSISTRLGDSTSIRSHRAVVSGRDSILNQLPTVESPFAFNDKDTLITKEDGFLKRKAKTTLKNVIRYSEKHPNDFLKSFVERYLHNLPKSLFVCMPFFTLLLALFYIRRKKYFTEHAIFTLHYHIFILFGLFIIMLLDQVIDTTVPIALFSVYIIIYQYKALKNVYHGKRWLNILKCLGIFALYYVVIIVVQILFLAYSLATVGQ